MMQIAKKTLTNSVDVSSIRGERFVWLLRSIENKSLIQQLSFECKISESIIELLVGKGLKTKQDILDYLFCGQTIIDSGEKLKDAKKAIERIKIAVANQEKILIFGDYDVDGMTSTSIILLSLIPLGANVNYYLPNRVKDGYGITPKIIQKASENNYSLIITVDNGTTAHDAADLALEKKIDLIITDHHQPKSDLPRSFALVNPHQEDCVYPNKDFCGAGVAFKLMDYLYQELEKELPEKVYELLTLGTIADVVPLVAENRFWVRYGLNLINKHMSFAFACLATNSNKLDGFKLTSKDLGFGIAPQLNALGRLDDPKDAIKFLISSEQHEVAKIGHKLARVNEQRKFIENEIIQEIENKIKNKIIDLEKSHIIFDQSESWPPGVIGLVAGRLTQNYGRPAFLLHIDKDKKIAKGSCRSIPEFNIFKALCELDKDLISYGGHQQAAGLACSLDNLELVKKKLNDLVSRQFALEELQPKIDVHASLELQDLNKKLIEDLDKLEPFGNQNPEPIFYFKNLSLAQKPKLLKDKHVKCLVYAFGNLKSVIFFNAFEIFKRFVENPNLNFDIIANVSVNNWQGKSTIELIGLDIKFH